MIPELAACVLIFAAGIYSGFIMGRNSHPDYEHMNQRIKGAGIREESTELKVEACEREIFHLRQQLLNCQTNQP